MTTLVDPTDPIEIPQLPSGSVKDFIPYLTKNPNIPIEKLLEPYKVFEGELRKVYAQQPKHEFLQDGTVNLIPIFNGYEKEVTVRARSLATETDEEKSKYLMPLSEEERKINGSPAIVNSLRDFQQNFNIFSESSLADLDWNNCVVAGSACTTSLLPVPAKWAESKRKLREYYHEHLAPASDVDIFLYGLDEEQALRKIKQIERNIKDSILSEVTTIRTKNAITIASQHPIRHVQIVLRLYSSISEILTGFDVDCSCAAYDGKQVYAAPRALAAFMTQCNTIDLTRRSPSYENRLSKYSHRGFEVHWPLLDRSRVDPTIFERSFGRTQGLARLLILEKLPTSYDRETYSDQRRVERGRPAISHGYRNQYSMSGNIKDTEEDEVAEWVDQEEVASYHTMTVPYGPKYNAAKINRLLYAKDLLLNAEWNVQKNRDVYLHRHPCFFGTAEEVLQDCCGYCPEPKTDEEIQIAEEESKTMVSGPLKFIISNPGAQMIGSFNPITDDEWTSMSYVGDTARLCQAIVDKDLEHVEDWCSQEGVDVNRRDYTGRTPLHLATSVSSVEVVKCLVDHGARLIARLVDGRTALHIASARGDVEIIKILMNRSLVNEEEEDEKEELRRAQRKAERAISGESGEKEGPLTDESKDIEDEEEDEEDDESSEASEISLNSEEGSDSMTMGSFVKIDNDETKAQEDAVLEDSSEDPDVYEIDVIAWDFGLSPLHYAIVHGHEDVIDLLVSEYGADVLLPVKLVEPGTSTPKGAIMTILLTLALPTEKAKAVTKQLLALGATSAQGDQNSITVFHHVASQNSDILDVLLENDRPVVMSVLNNLGSDGARYNVSINSPLTTAIDKGFVDMASKLLELGATTTIDYNGWVKHYLAANPWAKNQDAKTIRERHDDSVIEPIILAAGKGLARTVEQLLDHNADPNTLEKTAHSIIRNSSSVSYIIPQSLLDVVRQKLTTLREYKEPVAASEPETLEEESFYTCSHEVGTYQYFTALKDFQHQREHNQAQWDDYNKKLQDKTENGVKQKEEAIAKLVQELEHTEKVLIDAGAKSFVELHPQVPKHQAQNRYGNTYTPPPVPPYETNITFRTADLNNNTRQGYIDMFEAAWVNDLEKIKSLTLAPWETRKTGRQAPLKIGIEDRNGFTPFSIAVLRGHYDLAKKIVEICAAQYHKEDGLNSRKRWTLKTSSDNGYDEEDSDYDSDNHQAYDHLPIFAELVSEEFTIDNLGEVATLVKSDILPLTMINATCYPNRLLGTTHEVGTSSLLMYAVKIDNMDIFKFIMQLGAEQQALLAEEDDDQKCFSIDMGIFQEALSRGRTTMLAEMVRASGVAIPLNDLIKKSGIELKSKPKYYQGLSVGGKKRADWAQAPGETTYVDEETTPPLLQSAKFGNIDSVEWFMSNGPMRRYKEFAEANKHDKRIKTLQSGKGFEKTISTWLNAQSEYVLHCAVLHQHDKKDSAKYIELLKHIISVAPESLERKSSEGWTPLQVAVFAQQIDAVSYLISIGANQRSRDKMGRNMVHSMMVSKGGSTRTTHQDVESLIKLFDKKAVKEMLVERCSIHPGALTPLGLWMFFNTRNGGCKNPSVLEVLAEYSEGEDLEMINGEGDLPLHVAVRQNLSTITSYLLNLKPSLLYRENATGRTPLEMARDSYTTSQVNTPLSVSNSHYWQNYSPGQEDHQSIIHKQASDFVKKDIVEESQKRTWEICNEIDQKMSEAEKKRRLVSLFEANEVAKRVAARGGFKRSGFVINGGLVDGDVKTDIVSEWLN